MDTALILIGAALTAAAITAPATRAMLPWLVARRLMDAPNARSSHSVAKPRGAGPAIAAGMILPIGIFGALSLTDAVLGLGIAGLCALGFLDDRRSLPALTRLAVQAMVTALCMTALPEHVSLTAGLVPPGVERAAICIGWIWIINLTNFMDGIDGITGVQMAFVGAGCALCTVVMQGQAGAASLWGGVLAGAGIGFLVWNWPPSRLFMGDSGSLILGLISGYVSIELALSGGAASAVLLNGVFWSDATITLLRRIFRGEAIWRAHRQHTYQRAALILGDHRRALWVVIVLNSWLFLFAIEALEPDRRTMALGLGALLLAAYHLIIERLRPPE